MGELVHRQLGRREEFLRDAHEKNPLSGIEKRVCEQFRQYLELLEDFGGVTSNRTDALFRQLAFGECVIHFHV